MRFVTSSPSYPPDIACIPAFQEAEHVARAAGIGLWSNPPMQIRLSTLKVLGSETPCNCSGPDLDCKANFSTHNEAQACYDYCVSQALAMSSGWTEVTMMVWLARLYLSERIPG
jgi:hypothetical protein